MIDADNNSDDVQDDEVHQHSCLLVSIYDIFIININLFT